MIKAIKLTFLNKYCVHLENLKHLPMLRKSLRTSFYEKSNKVTKQKKKCSKAIFFTDDDDNHEIITHPDILPKILNSNNIWSLVLANSYK